MINLVDGETAVSRMPGHILSMLVVMGLAMVSATPATGGEPGRFVDETFEHFTAGRLGGGGVNLYVARDGTVFCKMSLVTALVRPMSIDMGRTRC